MMENERIRAAQAESEKAAAEALALVEELKNKPPPEPAVVAEPEVVEPEKKVCFDSCGCVGLTNFVLCMQV